MERYVDMLLDCKQRHSFRLAQPMTSQEGAPANDHPMANDQEEEYEGRKEELESRPSFIPSPSPHRERGAGLCEGAKPCAACNCM